VPRRFTEDGKHEPPDHGHWEVAGPGQLGPQRKRLRYEPYTMDVSKYIGSRFMKYEHAHLEALLAALDATRRALRRNTCGDWTIRGKRGHIYADGSGFLIVVSPGDSIRRWTNTKRKLDFCRVTQDGDDEGCLHLDHLPTPKEADLIRETVRIRRKRRYTPDQLADITARLKKHTTRDPLWARTHSSKTEEGGKEPKLI
jgi:hypothetical protein